MKNDMNMNSDLSERVNYLDPDFPVYVRRGLLSSYANYSAISHWHDDLEFIYIKSGEMHYNINGDHVILHAGEGLFVNARQLHYGFSPDYQECDFICIIMHPMLLCASAYIEKHFVLPILQNENLPYLILHPDKTHEARILDTVLQIYEATLLKQGYALHVQNLYFDICEDLYALSSRHVKNRQAPHHQHLSVLKNMIRFITSHYTEKITLADISQAGPVSKTSCCTIFQKYTSLTPMSYLMEFRLKKSLELLLTTDRSISEICFEVGFSGASYYSEMFKKIFKCTPSEYRAGNLL